MPFGAPQPRVRMPATTPTDIRQQLAICYKDNARKLYFCAYSVVRNFPEPADAARDIVAESFCKALRGEWRGDSSLYTFLFSCTRNLALDYIRRHENAKRIRCSRGGNVGPVADVADGMTPRTAESRWQPSDVTPRPYVGPERAYMIKERRQLVRFALDNLCTAREATVWELCKLDGQTTTAAADVIGVSQPTAYRALSLANNKIADHITAMTA